MSSDIHQIKIGLTDNHPCSYLPERKERVAVALEADMHTAENYEVLLANGFRRSGNTIYKPHCDSCHSCLPIRISVPDFTLSKSQKRLLAKSRQLRWSMKSEMDEDWFELYSH